MSAEMLLGNWKLVSWQVVTDGETKDLLGSNPKGYLILTREGRAMALTTAEGRKAGESEAERAALHKSMLAYTGKYRVGTCPEHIISWQDRFPQDRVGARAIKSDFRIGSSPALKQWRRTVRYSTDPGI